MRTYPELTKNHAVKTYGGRGMDPRIIKLGTIWNKEVTSGIIQCCSKYKYFYSVIPVRTIATSVRIPVPTTSTDVATSHRGNGTFLLPAEICVL
jgi:hypothetical protein